jgi:hypothetical protein
MRYMNQVFSSSVNLGTGGNSPSPFRNVKPQYIPDIPMNFNKNLLDADIIKPKNRFKNWKPIMRNLQSI